MGKVKIELKDISKSYYSETAVTQALRKVSLTFDDRGFVVITGESGSGKSTLLHIIGGMDTFDEGEMYVDGKPTFQYDDQDWEEYRRNRIGYIFQDYSLVGHYTALSNIASALLVMGNSREQAEETAMRYLKQVGLEGWEMHKASELSSGQKQRLSIARALAKNTGIIVADEPTGNLDSETGEQIVRLLKELSKTCLVIMVTHNYEQAEAYATRRIRLHDGNVVSDVAVNQEDAGDIALADGDVGQEMALHDMQEGVNGEQEPAVCGIQTAVDAAVPEMKKSRAADKDGSRRWKEFCGQSRVASYFAAMNCRTQRGRALLFTSFLLVIGVVSFLFIGQLFMHGDDTLTKEYSSSVFYRKDPTRIVVKQADGGDITEEDVERLYSVSGVRMVDSCDYANDINYYIEEGEDYKYLYGASASDDGRSIRTLSFHNENRFMMSTDCISEADLSDGRMPESRNEIVLYSKDNSVLGTEEMCYFTAHNLWGVNQYYGKNLTVVGILKEKTDQVYFSKELCKMLSLHMDYGEYRFWYGEKREEFIPMIAEDLEGDNVRKSYKFCSADSTKEDGPIGDTYFTFQAYDSDGRLTGDVMEQQVYAIPGSESVHEMSAKMMEVSEEFFYTYCPKDRNSTQASVYLTSYAKVRAVKSKLEKMGYEAQSTYQLGVTDYIDDLVDERLVILGVSAFGLVAVLLTQILILRSLMKIRVKDYFVLKFIGMRMPVIRKISYFEIGVYCAAAIVLTVFLMWALRIIGIPVVQEIMWYYDFGSYLVFAVYNLVASALTVFAFNHLLKKRLNA